jgi:hypothetical protein
MALAEPGRSADGSGDAVTGHGHGHVSMVFVHPQWRVWHRRCDARRASPLSLDRGWSRLTFWTRESNVRARRLHQTSGYRPTGATGRLPSGERTMQLERA